MYKILSIIIIVIATSCVNQTTSITEKEVHIVTNHDLYQDGFYPTIGKKIQLNVIYKNKHKQPSVEIEVPAQIKKLRPLQHRAHLIKFHDITEYFSVGQKYTIEGIFVEDGWEFGACFIYVKKIKQIKN